jgi:hypothetical protein
MMKCYIGGSTYPGDFDFIAACFAENKNEAKKILWNDGDLSDECEGEYLNLHVIRMPKHDNLFGKTGRSDAHVVKNNSICREMFFSMEGDSRCAACGLAEYEGLWPLCENCEQCSECGHDDGCELGALL